MGLFQLSVMDQFFLVSKLCDILIDLSGLHNHDRGIHQQHKKGRQGHSQTMRHLRHGSHWALIF